MRYMEEGTQEGKSGRARGEARWTLTSEENESGEEEDEEEGEERRREGELDHHHCKWGITPLFTTEYNSCTRSAES